MGRITIALRDSYNIYFTPWGHRLGLTRSTVRSLFGPREYNCIELR